MSELPEDLVFARHPRRRGEVLMVGVGAVGSLTAQQLVRMGISPLWLLDKDILKVHNIVRHVLGETDLGKNKAEALADRIRRDFSQCEAHGSPQDFLDMSWEDQLQWVSRVDLVVAATDELECQRQVNRACLAAEIPAVYPAVWVDDRVRPAEVGEVLWVLPGRHTPCYECAVTFRQGSLDAQAARGAMLDIQQVALATAHIVGALLDPASENAAILDPRRTLIYLHGFTPTSPRIRASFPVNGLFSRNIEVPFPQEPCPACSGQTGDPRPRLLPGAPPPMPPGTRPRQPRVVAPPPHPSRLLPPLPLAGLLATLAALGLLSWGLLTGVGALVSWVHSLTASSHAAAPVPAAPSASPSPSSSPPSVPWTSPASFPITYPVDMAAACVQQYGQGTSAQLASTSVPSYDVVCVNGGSDLGGLDLDSFCTWLAQQDHYRSAGGWWAGNPERFDTNTSDQPWMDWSCYDNQNRP